MPLLAVILALVSTSQAGCRTIPDTSHIQLIGRFSDMRYTEEHAYGHAVELWRAGDCVFGLFENSVGRAASAGAGRAVQRGKDVWYREPHPIQAAADSRLRQDLVHLAGWTYRCR